MKHFFITSLIILILIMLFTKKQKEGFLNDYCKQYNDCETCAETGGCSWCSKAKLCVYSKDLKSTDECNQNNVTNSSFMCNSTLYDKIPPQNSVNIDLEDYDFYKNEIKNKIPPPNVYTNEDILYSKEDIMSSMNNVRNDIKNLNTGLPGIISSSIENNIKPMVKGILSDNYYIQGFKNYIDLSF